MKATVIKTTAIATMVLLSFGLFAQTPPHPNGGTAPSRNNTPVGGGAPIDGGLTIMLLLGAVYAGKSLLKMEEGN